MHPFRMHQSSNRKCILCKKLLNSLNRQHTLLLQQHYPLLFFFTLILGSRSYMSSSEVALFGSLHSSVSIVGQNIYFPIIPENTETTSVLNHHPKQVFLFAMTFFMISTWFFTPYIFFPLGFSWQILPWFEGLKCCCFSHLQGLKSWIYTTC